MATAASSSRSSSIDAAGPSASAVREEEGVLPENIRDIGAESESPTRSIPEGSLDDQEDDNTSLTGPNPTRDAIADGIVSLLSPTLKTLDEGVLATKKSQEELSEQIALLTDQLKIIAAEQVCPIDLDGYVNRLGTIKGKINVISSVLHTAQDRLNKVHDQAVKEASRRKPLIEPSPVSSSARSSVESPDPEPPDNQNPSSSSSSTNILKEAAEAQADATS